MSALDALLKSRGMNSRAATPPVTPALPRSEERRNNAVTDKAARTCIVHAELAQGTPEWSLLRAGIPTASGFDRIITPKGEPTKSTTSRAYLHALIAERLMGHPIVEKTSHWMDRGKELEPEAVRFYEFQRDAETVKIGFVTTADRAVGASPDRFVGDEGMLETKVPSEAVHVSYLLTKSVEAAYYPQAQGQLWVCQRVWNDILSYHPEMPPALIRVERDEAFIAKLDRLVTAFSLELEKVFLECLAKGWGKENRPPPARKKPRFNPMESIEVLAAQANATGAKLPEWAQ